jgi:hypothetical protein
MKSEVNRLKNSAQEEADSTISVKAQKGNNSFAESFWSN